MNGMRVVLLIALHIGATLQTDDFLAGLGATCTNGRVFNEQKGKCEEPSDSLTDIIGVGCKDGKVFNEETEKCEDPKTVIRITDPFAEVGFDCGDGKVFRDGFCTDATVTTEKPKMPISNEECCCCLNKNCTADADYFDLFSGDDCGGCQCISKDDGCVATVDDFTLRLADDNDNCQKNCSDFPGYQCVKSNQCREGRVITDGSKALIPFTLTVDLADKACPNRGQTCCKVEDSGPSKPTEPAPPQDYSKCGRIQEDHSYDLIDSSRPENLIVGDTAKPAEFPHMCAIFKAKGSGLGSQLYIGGASLITDTKLLTVGHKFRLVTKNNDYDYTKDTTYNVRCGEINIKAETNTVDPYQDRNVINILLDPEYDPKFLSHNLAILVVGSKFKFAANVGPACLPSPRQQMTRNICYSTGWGSSRFDNAVYSDLLKKVALPFVPREVCKNKINALPRFKRGKRFELYDDWMCVGGERGRDTCRGDGGSPHVCKIDNKWIQMGVVAFGFGCGDGNPAVYQKVAESMCWIDWVMSCGADPSDPLSLGSNIKNVVDIRNKQVTVDSVNKLSADECQAWLDGQENLKKTCNIRY